MASIMEQHQGVSQGSRRARKVPQQEPSEGKSLSKDKSKERWRTRLSDNFWSRCLNLLLLFCFVNYVGSAPAGNTPRPVMGEKGDNATLPCEFEARDIIDIILSRRAKNILVCHNDECKSENGRLFKKGTCDVIIKDLIFDDAGTYILRVHYTDDQRKWEQLFLEYHLHIQDEISVKTGEQLKMDVLLINADKVEKNSSGEWTEVWTRGHGVSSDRLTDRDGNLTISNFTVSDTGTYRVLDSEGEIWITVTVTQSGTGSKGKLNKDDDDKPNKLYTVESRIIVVCVSVTLLALVISALIWKYKCQNRNAEHESVPMEDIQ